MLIEIKSTNTRQETTKNNTVRHKQQAALLGQGDYPLPFWLDVPEGRPYSPGRYAFAPESFRLTRYQSIELDPYGIKLVPAETKKASAA